MNARRGAWLSLLLLLLASGARAHKPSDSYLQLELAGTSLRGHWDLALYDLSHALALDDGDGALTWGELRAQERTIAAYAREHLSLRGAHAACQLELEPLALVEHSDGGYARLPLRGVCPQGHELTLRYQALFAIDRQHRAIVTVARVGREAESTVLSHDSRELVLSFDQGANESATIEHFVLPGIVHILSGLDHVLFLVVLLLPCMLQGAPSAAHAQARRAGDARDPAIRSLLWDVSKIVTGFTIAHSVTLSASALGLVRVSAQVIEPAIALSVALAAADNLWPRLGSQRWVSAFALGLLHGFGFSSGLLEAGLPRAHLLRALLGFNLGVELGQLAVLLLLLPLAHALRRARGARLLGLRFGSLAVLLVSFAWFLQRIDQG